MSNCRLPISSVTSRYLKNGLTRSAARLLALKQPPSLIGRLRSIFGLRRLYSLLRFIFHLRGFLAVVRTRAEHNSLAALIAKVHMELAETVIDLGAVEHRN